MDKIKKIVKNDPRDRIEVEVGDLKQQDWFPQVKLMRWDNEVNLSVRHEGGARYNFYDTEEGEGGYEFEVILDEKPNTNKVRFTVNHKELDFFYQPELTPEEIAEGSERPEDVVGSYAVYHKTKGGLNRSDGMDYKVGKAFHIYRPYVQDANGVAAWADLNVTGANLTITIPQDFLDNAVYPVTVDPTFGYESVGGSNLTWQVEAGLNSACTLVGSYTASSGDEMSSISMYAWNTTTAGDMQGRIYSLSSGLPSTGVGTKVTVTLSTTQEWVTTSYSASLSDGVQYGTGFADTATPNEQNLKYDEGSTPGRVNANPSDTSLPDTWPGSSSDSGRHYSIYATYTASGGGDNVINPLYLKSLA